MGDGINDGPSLKVADVSVSVDTAADIAKESADIILLEKSLLVLQQGVLEGRRVFGNLMKYLKIASSSNLGNVISMLFASALLPFLPMAPVQILMNDLLYDLSQSAVPTDYVDDEYLKSPKTWDMRGITHYMFFIGPISSLFDCLLFVYMWFVLKANNVEFESLFQTGWFIESLLSQTLIVHILRTGKIPFLESTASPALLFTTITISLIGILLPYTALGEFLKMQALPSEYWFGLAVLLVCYLTFTQLIKTALIKRYGLV
jgi:Mg2+-importing ATPase